MLKDNDRRQSRSDERLQTKMRARKLLFQSLQRETVNPD